MKNTEEEIWRDCLEYGHMYQISNKGRVKSVNRIFIKKNNARITVKGKVIKSYDLGRGYSGFSIQVNGHVKYFYVHRVVAIAFIPNPENKPFVNHINGIKKDNTVENLEWCTRQENVDHAIKNNLYSRGEKFVKSKLKDKDVLDILSMKGVLLAKDIAKKYGVATSRIYNIFHNKAWTHIKRK